MKLSRMSKAVLITAFALSSALSLLPAHASAPGNGGGGLYTATVKAWSNGGWVNLVVSGTSMAQCELNVSLTITQYSWSYQPTGVSYPATLSVACHAGQTSEQPRSGLK